MNPEATATLDALEHQRRYLSQVLTQLQTTDRVRVGTSTAWWGPARGKYEEAVADFTTVLDRAERALEFAVGATQKAISEVVARG